MLDEPAALRMVPKFTDCHLLHGIILENGPLHGGSGLPHGIIHACWRRTLTGQDMTRNRHMREACLLISSGHQSANRGEPVLWKVSCWFSSFQDTLQHVLIHDFEVLPCQRTLYRGDPGRNFRVCSCDVIIGAYKLQNDSDWSWRSEMTP